MSASLVRLIDELSGEQQELSAVDLFSRRHESGELAETPPIYEERIPIGRVPLPGQQLAFRVDLDSCTGCKACVTACHSLNGLGTGETWRQVGLLVGADDGTGVQQTVTTACHHCVDPACLAGCPVQAYEKDPLTGIVRHLDDQCIGCQYCMMTCVYDVPQFDSSLGIVRKCDMCTGRLQEGEAPACVQGCPNGAITIEIVDQDTANQTLSGVATLPDASITHPTTRYVSERAVDELLPADLDRLSPSSAHDPLAVMLVLMQLSVGTLLFSWLASAAAAPWLLVLAAGSAVTGLVAATLHLGRPVYAFRAFLGWRTSWMSREILVFGGYVPLAVASAAAAGMAAWGPGLGEPFIGASRVAGSVLPWLRAVATVLGLAGTGCSIMIYVATRRPAWARARTTPLFVGSLFGLGALAATMGTALAAWLEGEALPALPFLTVGFGVLLGKLVAEWRQSERTGPSTDAIARGARLLRGPLRERLRLRFGLSTLGLAASLASAAALALELLLPAMVFAGVALAGCTLGELVERHLYFTAEASPGMPGT